MEIASKCSPSSCSISTNTMHKSKVRWWNNECAITHQNRKTAYHIMKKTSTIANFVTYRKLRAKTTFKMAKRSSWQQFKAKINKHTSPTIIWNNIQAIEKRRLFTLPVAIKLPDAYAKVFNQWQALQTSIITFSNTTSQLSIIKLSVQLN